MKLSKASRPSPALVLAALALVFAMVGTAIAGPDAISNKITKPKVKKIAKKQANKVLNQRESSLNVNRAQTADNASQLGGSAASAFHARTDCSSRRWFRPVRLLRSSTVAEPLALPKLPPGSTRWRFNRDVQDCAWIADYGERAPGGIDAKFATTRGVAGEPDRVGVVIWDAAGAQVDGDGFHLAVFCP